MSAFDFFLDPGAEERRCEIWRHWARMPAVTRHEASALLSGIIPSENWDHESISRKRASFGEELNQKYLRTSDLLMREGTVGNFGYQIPIAELIAWARKNGLAISEKFSNALDEINVCRSNVHMEAEVEAAIETPDKQALGTRERETLLYLIATMSIQKYGFHPNKRNKAVAEIQADFEKLGMGRLGVETIRSKLKAASELVPQKAFKDSASD